MNLVPPEALPAWIPGQITLDSGTKDWRGISLKGYYYPAEHVHVPPMRDYMIVVYEGSSRARMGRCAGRQWEYQAVGPGVISLLTRAEYSQWAWSAPILVTHVYLSHDQITATAGEAYEREIDEIIIPDQVRAEDDVLPAIARMLKRELQAGELGGVLMSQTLCLQACIHVLRHYARTRLREPAPSGGLTPAQKRLLLAFIEEHLSSNFTLDEMAHELGLSLFHFARKFRQEFGCPPHRYVIQLRVSKAIELLRHGRMSLKEIAAECGFADQSHMTRLVRQHTGRTPKEIQQAR